jgi:murein DD-endopeptidase MepM/ murein hydrolase activator NlpD
MRLITASLVALAAMALVAPAHAAGDPEVAALQVGLRARGVYAGTVDGVMGPATAVAVRTFQLRAGLVPSGMPGRQTRLALGAYGRRAPLGRRTLVPGARGWDVAALQFSLAWHGFPSGAIDGHLGSKTEAALRRFQIWAGVRADGTAGLSTFAALRRPIPVSPIRLTVPVQGALGDGYGPRGARFHSGLDFVAAGGTPVAAAASGRVVFAGRHTGGWGNLVVLQHGRGVRTFYAHLARISVKLGRRVSVGANIGAVGATGNATGPHLHFEVLVRGAAVDPQTAF